MQRYVSKPTEIEAYQLTQELVEKMLFDNDPPPGVTMLGASYHSGNRTISYSKQSVETIQGQRVEVSIGEWIVKEPDGVHFYPISDEIFRQKYELI